MRKMKILGSWWLILLLCATVKAESIKLKKTILEFYVHDQFTGLNKTVVQSGGPGSTANLQFGLTGVVDDLITQGKSPKSKALGRMQGTYSAASLDGFTLFTSFSAVLASDKYNGSLAILGANRISLPQRFVPVVGGTGCFDRAHGFATTQTISSDPSSAIFHYKIEIAHL